MKKIATAVIMSAALISTAADAISIGRGSSSSSSDRGSSFSSSSASKSYASAAPSSVTSRPGGIGGTTGSVGVRKSEVTNGVRSDIAQGKPYQSGTTSSYPTGSTSYTPHYAPTPSYGHVAPPAPTVTNTSTFMSSLGGSFLGSAIGNSLFGHHGGSGTTAVNNGVPAPSVQSSGSYVGPAQGMATIDGGVAPSVMTVQKPAYTVWSFIGDVFGFAFLAALLAAIAWALYKGYKYMRGYINKERGVSTIPFNPTQRFWEIQRAFSTADVPLLSTLLGPDVVYYVWAPDVVDELTANLSPSKLTLSNVSHEVRLQTPSEFSVWYKFTDKNEEVDQVWHYEKFGPLWKLNGIENV